MKKFSMYAVALSLVCTACSSDALVEEISTTHNNSVYMAQKQSSLHQLIAEISEACQGLPAGSMAARIALAESQAFQTEAFRQLAQQGYTTPSLTTCNYLENSSPAAIISGLSYSATVKSLLYDLIIEREELPGSVWSNPSFTSNELELLEVCSLLAGDQGGNGDDDANDGDIRHIAFAYGYQTSGADAVVMAVVFSVQ